jgi:hypothetical protein
LTRQIEDADKTGDWPQNGEAYPEQ